MLPWRYVEDLAGGIRRERGLRQRGNGAAYLTARIARDRPDVLDRMRAGAFKSVHEAAIAAGIVRLPAEEDRALARLVDAWVRATPRDRQVFLALLGEEELAAAGAGEPAPDPLPPPRRGPAPYAPAANGAVPEVEALLEAGATVSDVARRVGVAYRTVARWRAGAGRPRADVLERLRAAVAAQEGRTA